MASSRFWAGSDEDSSEEGSDASSADEQEKVKSTNRPAPRGEPRGRAGRARDDAAVGRRRCGTAAAPAPARVESETRRPPPEPPPDARDAATP